MAKRTGRQRSQLPNCYYEGYLDKRSFKDKTSRKLWACLCGNSMFFFNEKRDADYVEKIDLSGFMSITDDNSQDRILDAARINLQMKNENIKFTAPNAEARELWKGYIHSIAELSVPSSLNLLPGQVHMLKQAVEEEKERLKSVSTPSISNSNPYISLKADMPACYQRVSRLSAELLLEREAKRGNLLLRPGSEANSFAVTTRQDLDGSVFRHYKVTRVDEGGFIIDVDNPVPCATLHDVVTCLVEKTEGVLIPLTMEGTYERRISFIMSDEENGERTIKGAPLNQVPPSLPPKPAPKIPTPEPASEQEEKENIYLNDQLEEKEEQTGCCPMIPLPPPKKAIMPPIPTPRRLTSPTPTPSSASISNNQDPKMRVYKDTPGQIHFAALSELKLKLEQKGKV
ncbi:signal-transducing adaptor protein 1-like [Notolabrus celidotus]|uniref:signal-transducing adaptor protein 1-like n=1 Tax=Notolabrus celidotus TaxID=1203425 RepID=UPI0014900C40|nr:signal-transducing adaptor protein 1-like [Notolabrus celidotus]